jgi:hypothetical protein
MGPNPLITQWNLLYQTNGIPWTRGSNCGEDDSGYMHPPHRVITTIATDPDGQWSVGSATTGYSDQQTFVLPDLADRYQIGSTNPIEWKTYFHCYPTHDGGVMLQYWHLFAYNGMGVFGIGHHGGDWDAVIHVQLNPDLQTVKRVWFSRHQKDSPGDAFGPGQVTFLPGTSHPLMTIDGGGHAAFASLDDHTTFVGLGQELAGSTVVWPSDMGDVLNPAKLWGFSGAGIITGGVVWETWTGGGVLSTPNWYGIPSTSGHGGLVNLGEYNPCADGTCYGSAQACKLLAGQFWPLNGQIFIRYEGKWGSLPSGASFGLGEPPRGPVFQGFQDYHDDGDWITNKYTAWYNEGADDPANVSYCPWRRAPSCALDINNLFHAPNGVDYISGTSLVSLGATQSTNAAPFGNVRSCYRVYAPGGPYRLYTHPFSVEGTDGPRVISYYALDALNNQSDIRSKALTLDGTAPTIVIAQPTNGTYVHSATLTLNYSASDGIGSGVKTITPQMDSATTLAGHGLASGQLITLLTEMSLGQHTFTVNALDNVSNASSASITFEIIVTPQSIMDDIQEFLALNMIGQNEGNSLLSKLTAAARALQRGNATTARNLYQAFVNEVQAQTGKGISPLAAQILIADAQFLVTPALRVRGKGLNSGAGRFALTVSNPTGVPLIIEKTEDFRNWTPVATNSGTGQFDIEVPASSAAKTFYRARLPN